MFITVREYRDIYNELEEHGEHYYEALKYFCKLTCMRSSLSRMKDLPAMTASEFEKLAQSLAMVKTQEEYDKILNSIKN